MANLYLTPAEKYTAALGGFYYGDLPEPGTVYTQLIKDILGGSTPDKEPKNILARFIYSLYISDLGDPYPRYELAKLLYWKLHDITPTKSGSILTVTIDGKEDYMTINTDLSRLWYKVLFGSKTDVITEFPYIFNTMQNKLSDWELFGNVEVSGTPTPDNPIMPQGTGERTGNLFPFYNQQFTIGNVTYTCKDGTLYVDGKSTGEISSSNPTWKNNFSFMLKAGSYKVAYAQPFTRYIKRYSDDSTLLSDGKVEFTLDEDTMVYLGIYQYNREYVNRNIQMKIMPKSDWVSKYVPTGYKIQISSANTTTPVYLGEVQTTRRIKKLVLTGEETSINKSGTYAGSFYISGVVRDIKGINYEAYCSHASYTTLGSYAQNTFCFNGSPVNINLWFSQFDSNSTTEEFRQYLAQQYAAGTPVTIWYVLAESEVGVVNEPLMKIGEYADSMSRAQTGIDIPTVIGQNTLDVLTTVKPSSMSIEYISAEENQSRSKRISLLKSPLKKGLIK